MLSRFVRHRSRLPLGAAAAGIGVLCVTAAVAFAGHPAPGAHYKGQIENSPVNTVIKFKVSNDGTEIKRLRTKLDPIFNDAVCGGVTPSVTQESDPAHISRKGKFRGKITYTYPESGNTHGKAIVKGKFRRHHRAAGKVKATFNNPDCNGTAHFQANVIG
jgi:hypothetical protein